MSDDSADSIEALEQAVRALPENLPLRRQPAARLVDARRFEDALGHATEAIARAPVDAATMALAARCQFELGRYAGGAFALRRRGGARRAHRRRVAARADRAGVDRSARAHSPGGRRAGRARGRATVAVRRAPRDHLRRRGRPRRAVTDTRIVLFATRSILRQHDQFSTDTRMTWRPGSCMWTP